MARRNVINQLTPYKPLSSITMYMANGTINADTTMFDGVCTGTRTSAGLVIDYPAGVPPAAELAPIFSSSFRVVSGNLCLSNPFNFEQALRAFVSQRNVDLLSTIMYSIRRHALGASGIVLCDQGCRCALSCMESWINRLSDNLPLKIKMGISEMDLKGARLAISSAQLADFVGFHSNVETRWLVNNVFCRTDILDYRFEHPGKLDARAAPDPAASNTSARHVVPATPPSPVAATLSDARRSSPSQCAGSSKRRRQEQEQEDDEEEGEEEEEGDEEEEDEEKKEKAPASSSFGWACEATQCPPGWEEFMLDEEEVEEDEDSAKKPPVQSVQFAISPFSP